MPGFTSAQLISLVLVFLLIFPKPIEAQRPSGPDLVIEALQLHDRCVEEKERNLEAAKADCGQADRVLAGFRSNNPDETAAAGRLRGELANLLGDIGRRDADLKSMEAKIRKHIADKRLTTARSLLNSAGFPSEDPRPKRLEESLSEKEAEVKRLVKEADSLSKWEPKRSLAVYDRARELNHELVRPVNEMEQAAMARNRQKTPGCHAACRITITVLVLAGVGAGGYYGYHAYQKQQTTNH